MTTTHPPLKPDAATAVRFLQAAWGDPLPGNVLIWTMERRTGTAEPRKLSYWLDSPQDLERLVVRCGDSRNIYLGMGLPGPNTPRTPHNRCVSDEVAGICGVGLDIDFDDPGAPAAHKKAGLPPNIAAAQELIRAMPLPPTVVVNTGHGLQPWWLFTRPWRFADAAERDRAKTLSHSWNAHLVALAGKRGWAADNVGDLARVLRLPGTLNLKPNCPPAPVTVLTWDGPRYSPEELAAALPLRIAPPSTPRAERGQTGTIAIDGASLTAAAEPPAAKFQQAMRSKRFAASWNKDRPDLADQSASGYDFSLATLGAAFGWSDSEIGALLVAHHRRHGSDLKLRRPRYYAYTIGKARAAVAGRRGYPDYAPAANSPDGFLTIEELAADLGKWHVGPGEVRRPLSGQGEQPNVRFRVYPPDPLNPKLDNPRSRPHRWRYCRTGQAGKRPRRSGERPYTWQQAGELFPLPAGRGRCKAAALFNQDRGQVVLVDLLSSTWRHPVNAQHKRRKLCLNLLPHLCSEQVYQRKLPIDDADRKGRQALQKLITRRGGEYVWFDNGLARGYRLYLTNAPGLPGFEPVDNPEAGLVDALKAITPPPPDTPGRFRPVGGSREWTARLDEDGEENKEKWKVIGKKPGSTDFIGVEAEAVVSGYESDYVPAYWRGQLGSGLLLNIGDLETAATFLADLGYTLVGPAQGLAGGVGAGLLYDG